MLHLSLCMIVKNEELTLPRCLASVRDVVDEMVILDTGSTDRTIALGREWGAQVYQTTWQNDFAAARNQALQYVQGEWVLVLDGDEVLLPEVIPTLKQLIQRDALLVVNLLRQELGASQTPYSLVSRLFRRHPDLHFSRPYHEWIDPSVEDLRRREPEWQIGFLSQVAIAHTGYRSNVILEKNKMERARQIMAAYLAEHPEDTYLCSKLGGLYLQMGEVQRGLQLLQQGLAADPAESTVRYEIHYHLGLAYTELAQLTVAATHYQLALAEPLPDLVKLAAYLNWGNLLKDQGDVLGAETQYRRVVELAPDFAPGYYNLGLVGNAKKDYPGAIAAYEQAIHLQPNYAHAHQNLGIVLLKIGRVADSLAAFRRAINLLEDQNPLEAGQLRRGLAELGLPIH